MAQAADAGAYAAAAYAPAQYPQYHSSQYDPSYHAGWAAQPGASTYDSNQWYAAQATVAPAAAAAAPSAQDASTAGAAAAAPAVAGHDAAYYPQQQQQQFYAQQQQQYIYAQQQQQYNYAQQQQHYPQQYPAHAYAAPAQYPTAQTASAEQVQAWQVYYAQVHLQQQQAQQAYAQAQAQAEVQQQPPLPPEDPPLPPGAPTNATASVPAPQYPQAQQQQQQQPTRAAPLVIKAQMPNRAAATAKPAYISVASPAGAQARPPAYPASAATAATAAAAATPPAGGTGGTGTSATSTWPPAMQQWLSRGMQIMTTVNQQNPELGRRYRDYLMAFVTKINSDGRLQTHDWLSEVLPDPAQLMPQGGVPSPAAATAASPAGLRAMLSSEARERERHDRRHHRRSSSRSPSRERRWDSDRRASASRAGRGERGRESDRDSSASKRGRNAAYVSPRDRSPDDDERKSKRLNRFGASASVHANGTSKDAAGGKRMYSRAAATARGGGSSSDDDAVDLAACNIVGTSTKLEKSYFRLTTEPDPASIRPEPVLAAALARLLGIIASRERDYKYYLDQFKAMRQDCTVQHIKNTLSVRIYEAHARAALEYGDLADFNQCQTQLAYLYAEGLPGAAAEFAAYKLLYQVVNASRGENKGVLNTMRAILGGCNGGVGNGAAGAEVGATALGTGGGGASAAGATAAAALDPAAANALQVRQAVFIGDYRAFFEAYRRAPGLGRALLDAIVPRIRFRALRTMARAFRPTVPVALVAKLLGFLPPPPPPSADGVAAATDATAAAAVVEAAAESPTEEPQQPPQDLLVEAVASVPQSTAEAGAAEVSPSGELLPGCSRAVYEGRFAAAATEAAGLEACVAWLTDHGAVFQNPGASPSALLVDTKASKLTVPVDPNKVAHGDINQNISDFLSRTLAV